MPTAARHWQAKSYIFQHKTHGNVRIAMEIQRLSNSDRTSPHPIRREEVEGGLLFDGHSKAARCR